MEHISGLVWETEIEGPSSPKFWMLGYEWQCTLQLYYDFHNEPCYKIILRKLADDSPLDTYLVVTVYIRRSRTVLEEPHSRCLHKIVRVESAEEKVWSVSVKSADTVLGSEMHRGRWTVTLIFYSDQPLTLHLSKNETELASSEDKCVQACSEIPPDLEILSGDFRQLLEREILPDVRLRCGDRKISAHRSVLAAPSDVFTAMFRNKMVERETGNVDVVDMDSEVLHSLLQYIYSGKIQDPSHGTVSGLYEAGDKYSMHSLKKSCSDWMVRNLTAENCLGFLVVADAHSDEDFKHRVLEFVAENLELVKKDSWSKFNKDHGRLAISVYQMRLAPALAKQPRD